jgi:hypothetical protein
MIEVIGRIGYHPSRPERLSLIKPDGAVSSWFARDATRDEVAAILAANGMTLRDDDAPLLITLVTDPAPYRRREFSPPFPECP